MRYVVVGTSGSGKSMFAAALAARLGCPRFELDEFFWGPDWTPKPPEMFKNLVSESASKEHWVTDGNYSAVRAELWSRATHILWLNYSRPLVMARVVRRTVARALSGRPIWHGNRETLSKAFLSRKSIILWAATTFGKNRRKYATLRTENAFPQLQWLEFTSPAEADAFLRTHAATDG